eukprot:Phypoly_transcript_00929.p1 GENE.Phypoly_transcript_00929~~Phypoly_transcript_00929.p1  ORF type:complete len:1270 (+),score=119.92 Phypoly_transcript_00929:471-3812(+)
MNIGSSNFVNNTGSSVISVGSFARVTITGCLFRNNAGNVVNIVGAAMTITGSNFEMNSGIAVALSGNPTVLIDSSHFTGNNRAVDASGVFNFQMQNCFVSDSLYTAVDAHAPVTVNGCNNAKLTSVTFQRTQVISSSAGLYASALSIVGSNSTTLSKCAFLDNTGISCATVLYENIFGATLDLVTFSGNSGNVTAGLYFYQTIPGSLVTITNSYFSNNTALNTVSNGVITVDTGANLTMNNCTFEANSAYNGGALAAYGPLSCSNCHFTQNSATNRGGAVYSNASMVFSNSSFSTNNANQGGALYIYQSDSLTIDSCNLTNNNATNGGAAYVISATYFKMTDVNIENNTAYQGGGLYATNVQTARISSTIFRGNNATAIGGGIFVEFNIADFQIQDGSVTENYAGKTGDGIYLGANVDPYLTITNTFLSNLSPFAFCCAGTPKNNPSLEYCNYPSCSQGCGSTNTSCVCSSSPSLPCSCPPHVTGPYCNTLIEGDCDDPNCPGGCGYDSHFNKICCVNGLHYSAASISCTDQCTDTNCPGGCGYDTLNNKICCVNGSYYVNTTKECTDQCSDPKCIGGCGYDSQYNQICCKLGSRYVNATRKCEDLCFNATCPGGCGYDSRNNKVCCARGLYYVNATSVCAVDMEECTRYPNGGCDRHTSCTNKPGGVICGSCPFLFTGLGNETCTPLCGDKACDKAAGEDCIVCPLDCPSPCGLCGDSQCTTGESCKTCSEDCGPCKELKCPSDCSHHGTCTDGICVCTGNWGGPACDIENLNFTLKVSETEPSFSLLTNATENKIVFGISFKEIAEVDQLDNVINSNNFSNSNFAFTPSNGSSSSELKPTGPCSNCSTSSYVTLSGGISNDQYVANITLPNLATIEIMMWNLESATAVSFADSNSNFPAKTVKLAIQIRNWPFKSIKNSLILYYDAISVGNNDTLGTNVCVKKVEDKNKRLKWVTINNGGVSLYSQYTDSIISDGVKKQVTFELATDYSVSAKIPHFWINTVLDPSFSVLLDASECYIKKSVKIWEIVVPICVVVGILIAVAILFIPNRIRSYFLAKHHKRLREKRLKLINSRSMTSSSELEIIHQPVYEVRTDAGNYSYNMNNQKDAVRL